MLTGSNDRGLTYKGINEEFIYFFQRWQELLDHRTIDMYRYNILNSNVACLELVDVIDKTISGLLTSRQNVDDAKAETLAILKQDDILDKYNKPLHNTLLRITGAKIESKSKNESSDDKSSAFYMSINRLKYQVMTPSRILKENYLNYLLQEIKVDIDANNIPQLEKHMTLLVSQCINNGWSARGLFLLSKCFEGTLTSEEKWSGFSNKLTTQQRGVFEVYFGINIETRPGITPDNVRSVIQSLGMVVRKGSDFINDVLDRSNLYNKLDSSKYYIVVSVNATDLYSATLSAINQLNKKLSVATFYNTVSPWIANSSQIVTFCQSTNLAEALKITDVFRTYDYVDSTNNVFEDTKNILVNPDKSQIMTRLHAAFSYTNLSRTSLFQETKYISLWIAIESVMRTGQYPDIISHIKCVLPETLSIRYIYRILRNFSEDCIRCGFKQESSLAINMESTEKKALISSLISIFRDQTRYEILREKCQVNKLLYHRCIEIHSLLNSGQSIVKKFEQYTTKIRWHVQRLYRIRNEITHSAFMDDKSLTIYIEHLYTYLAQLVSEIVYYVEHKRVSTVEEAFSIILENYSTYIDLIGTGFIAPEDILSNGIMEIID